MKVWWSGELDTQRVQCRVGGEGGNNCVGPEKDQEPIERLECVESPGEI